jgi:hypothetical protein
MTSVDDFELHFRLLAPQWIVAYAHLEFSFRGIDKANE